MDVRECNNNCNVQSLSSLWLCEEPHCSAPLIRCSGCFKFAHSVTEHDKRKLHAHKKFDQSSIYDKFLYFIKLYELIEKKFKREFGKTNDHATYFATQIFNTSSFITLFLSQEALSQFHILKEIYYGRPSSFSRSPSADLSSSLSLFSQKQYNNAKNKLIQVKKEYELDLEYYNQVSSCNIKYLVQFVSKQQVLFTQYCDGIREKNQTFDINHYIKYRHGQKDVDKNYFTPIFQTFLHQKYSENPENQPLFTDYEYICYFWENLQLFLTNNDRKIYVNTWIQDYYTFASFMSTNSFESSLLSFRLWRNHTSSEKVRINDQYFLDNFVFSYIQFLINLENTVGCKSVHWEEYIAYFKDFADMYKSTNQLLDVFKYSDYFMFRTKTTSFINALKQAKQISFHQVYCTQYINSSYKQGSILSKKNYQKFLKTKQENEIEENNKFKAVSEQVFKQIQQQEGLKFYKIVYNDYLKQVLKQKILPSKQGYFDFKKDLLQSYDEAYIKETNDRLLLEQKQQLEKLLSDKKDEKVEKVTYSIDQSQAEVAQKEVPENEDFQDEGIIDQNCVCCEGRAEQCLKEVCQAMGFCVICSL